MSKPVNSEDQVNCALCGMLIACRARIGAGIAGPGLSTFAPSCPPFYPLVSAPTITPAR
jgi:hypothetical protein